MKASAVFNDAFLVCHEIYQAARELVNSRVPTTQLTSALKFLWRPDLRPRLVEYVADFARCGDRALGDTCPCGAGSRKTGSLRHPSDTSFRPEKPRDSARSFRARQQTSLTARPPDVHAPRLGAPTFRRAKPPRASRLILFRIYYLGGAEYQSARHLLGLSERTWSYWAEEVRQRVGAELIRARMYPPARYFREPAIGARGTATSPAPALASGTRLGHPAGCAAGFNEVGGTAKIRCATEKPSLGATESTNDAGEAKIHCCEQDFA